MKTPNDTQDQESVASGLVATAASLAAGWLALEILPRLVPKGQGLLTILFGIAIFAGAIGCVVALSYWRPRFWLLVGIAFPAPAIVSGLCSLGDNERGNLWPLGVVGMVAMIVLWPLIAYVGRSKGYFRRVRGQGK